MQTTITIPESNSFSFVLIFPAVAISWLVFNLVVNQINSRLVALVFSLAVIGFFVCVWRAVFTSISINGDEVTIYRNGHAINVRTSATRKISIFRFPPTFTIFIVIWMRDERSPVVAWSGFTSSSAGNFSETTHIIKNALSHK